MLSHTTSLFGVLAHPGGENLFHNILALAADRTDADAAFMLFDFQAKDIADPVEALRRLKAGGVYLTGRLRSAAGGVVDYLSDEAHGSGVINTIIFDGDTATGHNTEAKAIISLLEEQKDKFKNRSAVILGGGVMARAAAYAIIRHFRVRHVTIANRTIQQAQVLKQSIVAGSKDSVIEAHELFPPDIAQLLAESRLIVNATSIGSGSTQEETPITLPDIFHSHQVVFDVNYTNAPTKMLADAKEAGATVVDGRELLLRQLGDAFQLMTEEEFPLENVQSEIFG